MAQSLFERAGGLFMDPTRAKAFAVPVGRAETGVAGPAGSEAGDDEALDDAGKWLWPGWLRRGEIHVLLAGPFSPRRAVLVDLARRLSAGRLPGGASGGHSDDSPDSAEAAEKCRVLLAPDVVRLPKRADAWQTADRRAELLVCDGGIRPVDLPSDEDRIFAFLRKHPYDLLIVRLPLDRLSTAQAEQRLADLARLASRAAITPVILTGPRREARRPLGAVLKLKDLPHRNLIGERAAGLIGLSGGMTDPAGQPVPCHWHHLFSADRRPRALRIERDGGAGAPLRWHAMDPSALHREGRTGFERDRQTERAAGFLLAMLADQPRPIVDVIDQAAAAGISERAVRRAAKQLGVRSHRVGFGADGCHYWTRAA